MSGRAGMELTKFFQKRLREELEPEVLKLGFFKPAAEKQFLGIALDVYSYRRRGNRRFAVWEIEIHSGHHEVNVDKLQKILKLNWEPTVFMFHIFSPIYYPNEKKRCSKLAEKLEKKYPRRFIYEQIDLRTPYERFENMVNYFESSKYAAKQYYRKEIGKEIRRITRLSILALKSQ